jgi:hypothetical protein
MLDLELGSNMSSHPLRENIALVQSSSLDDVYIDIPENPF